MDCWTRAPGPAFADHSWPRPFNLDAATRVVSAIVVDFRAALPENRIPAYDLDHGRDFSRATWQWVVRSPRQSSFLVLDRPVGGTRLCG